MDEYARRIPPPPPHDRWYSSGRDRERGGPGGGGGDRGRGGAHLYEGDSGWSPQRIDGMFVWLQSKIVFPTQQSSKGPSSPTSARRCDDN